VEHTTPTVERAWLTYVQASEYTALDRTTLWRAVQRNELRAGGVGRAVRFERAELDRWIRGGEKK
jgi:excisionase family DNA binding protein